MAFIKRISIYLGTTVIYVTSEYGDTPENPMFGGRHGNQIGRVIDFLSAGENTFIRVKWPSGHENTYAPHTLSKVLVTISGKIIANHPLSDGKAIFINETCDNWLRSRGKPRQRLENLLDKDRVKGVFNI
jgi:hypothetical protein